MGEIDVRTREYVRDNSVFADICNYMLFDGEQVIKPEELVEKDPGELVMPFRDGDISIPVQKFRDVAKTTIIKETSENVFAIVGVENQAEINYATQVNVMGKKNRATKEPKKSAEFLSGISKDDKIIPVITIVLYWGDKKWNGARNLYDIFNINGDVLRFIPNYYINLISPNEIEDFTKFRTQLGLVLECIKYKSDKKAFVEMLKKRKDRFTNVERNTAELISEITNIKLTNEQIEGGKIDMCKAIEEMIDDAREELKEENDKLREENDKVKEENDKVREEIDKLKEEIDKLKEENNKFRSRND